MRSLLNLYLVFREWQGSSWVGKAPRFSQVLLSCIAAPGVADIFLPLVSHCPVVQKPQIGKGSSDFVQVREVPRVAGNSQP